MLFYAFNPRFCIERKCGLEQNFFAFFSLLCMLQYHR